MMGWAALMLKDGGANDWGGRQLRGSGRRRGYWLQKAVGMLMLAAALSYLFDPDWLLAGVRQRSARPHASAPAPRPQVLLAAPVLHQLGPGRHAVQAPAPLAGSAWHLVILDAEGAELHWSPRRQGRRAALSARAEELLASGLAAAMRVVEAPEDGPRFSRPAALPPR